VWLYFLLAGRVYRQRALQTLLTTIVMSVPVIIWVWYVSPHWIQELHANVMAFAVHGGLNDPGPASTGAHGLGMVISLQAIFSVFWDDTRIYNPASYLVFAPLLLLWMFVTLRYRSSPERTWLAIAAIAAFSMLPVYHRQYDAKLIALTVPACAMLWAEGGLAGRLALGVNTAAFVLTGDLPLSPVHNGSVRTIIDGIAGLSGTRHPAGHGRFLSMDLRSALFCACFTSSAAGPR
jgi:hypothetical protein